jgi:DNA topoisomerase-2
MEEYQKISAEAHVLLRPGMYLGEVTPSPKTIWVVRDTKMVEETHVLNNGPYKLLDEALLNARDHAVKCASSETAAKVTYLKVAIRDGSISVENDGEGIPVRMHATESVHVAELIFGHLRTSTNYDTAATHCVGGQNGYGIKLAAIWSTRMEVDLVGPDPDGKLKRYVQVFQRNLSEIEKPVITAYKKSKPYTKVTFTPDWDRFGSTLDEPMAAWLKRRVYDLAAVTDKKIKVYFNDDLVPVRSFQDYVEMYVDKTAVVEEFERWKFAVAVTDHAEFRQVSFVNGIHTMKGGKHVDYLMNQIVGKLSEYIQKKKKFTEPIRPAYIRNHLFLFLDACIENPTFDSQTKETLTTAPTKFGSKCEVSEKFIEKLARTGLLETVADQMKSKDVAAAAKTDGRKKRVITGIPKLCDAANAGTAKSRDCTLILTEGDSAKSAVLGGLTEKMRHTYGVYPLKGKVINPRVRNASENKEIIELKQILGLKNGQTYTPDNMDELRYGKVLIVTDQDLDGSHIKGLLVNMFDTLWPSLLRDPAIQFLGYMNTPIIKARKGGQEKLFYSEQEFHAWQQHTENAKGWTTKYYKGLGTSTSKEFAEYFQEGKSSMVAFEWSEGSGDAISKVFDGTRADDRKAWLTAHDPAATPSVDPKQKRIRFDTFIDEQLVDFSVYDNKRSIPNVMDGMKPSQRKILYACIKKGLSKKTEIKVAQLSGYVSEHTAYHHGVASLNGAIVGMAQDFVGSNNVNLLEPIGQFGTRLGGGDDSASERYIFTTLNEVTRLIFRPEDDAVLTYLYDDGQKVEPNYFVPIIPMALVNGSNGIGTGWSTQVLCYNPVELTEHLLAKIQGEPTRTDFTPFYRGFKGRIENAAGGKCIIQGAFLQKDELNYTITELPVGVWTNDYKQFLETLVGTVIKEYIDHCTDVTVKFDVKLLAATTEFEKVFKLAVTKTTTNMHMFNAGHKLVKYASVEPIIDEFMEVRRELYVKRKAWLLQDLNAHLKKATNKVRYMEGVLSGAIELRGLNKDAMVDLLRQHTLEEIDGDYTYLLHMPMISVSNEHVETLRKEQRDLAHQSQALETTTVDEMWVRDLTELKTALTHSAAPSKKRPHP